MKNKVIEMFFVSAQWVHVNLSIFVKYKIAIFNVEIYVHEISNANILST